MPNEGNMRYEVPESAIDVSALVALLRAMPGEKQAITFCLDEKNYSLVVNLTTSHEKFDQLVHSKCAISLDELARANTGRKRLFAHFLTSQLWRFVRDYPIWKG